MAFFTLNNDGGSSPVGINGKFALHKLNGDWVFYDSFDDVYAAAANGEHIDCFDNIGTVNITKSVSINCNFYNCNFINQPTASATQDIDFKIYNINRLEFGCDLLGGTESSLRNFNFFISARYCGGRFRYLGRFNCTRVVYLYIDTWQRDISFLSGTFVNVFLQIEPTAQPSSQEEYNIFVKKAIVNFSVGGRSSTRLFFFSAGTNEIQNLVVEELVFNQTNPTYNNNTTGLLASIGFEVLRIKQRIKKALINITSVNAIQSRAFFDSIYDVDYCLINTPSGTLNNGFFRSIVKCTIRAAAIESAFVLNGDSTFLQNCRIITGATHSFSSVNVIGRILNIRGAIIESTRPINPANVTLSGAGNFFVQNNLIV